jgi:hypothetical protein
MAVELRNAIAGALEKTLPATLLFKHPTLEGLTEFVMGHVGGDAQAAQPGAAAQAEGPQTDADADAVADLSDEEARDLLARELESWTAEET